MQWNVFFKDTVDLIISNKSLDDGDGFSLSFCLSLCLSLRLPSVSISLFLSLSLSLPLPLFLIQLLIKEIMNMYTETDTKQDNVIKYIVEIKLSE